jgi:two-component system sensor histidine kinase PilS (NtrC family)
MLMAVRVVVVTTVLLAAMLIQFTVRDRIILPIDYLYVTTAITFGLTILYAIVNLVVPVRSVNLYAQLVGDLGIVTMLVYFTGGLDSPFSFLYLVTIITAAMLLYRRGGMLIASGAVILYGALADLMYYNVIAAPPESFFGATAWTSSRLYLNMAANFVGFYATAFLASYVSEQLRRTSRELDVNRANLAQLQALNQNIIESIPSGLITTDPDGVVTFINPAACSILRIDQSVVGTYVVDTGIFSEEEWEQLSAAMPNRILRGEKDDYVRAGEIRNLGYAVTPLKNVSGFAGGLTIIFQDLTEMKKLEGQLRLKDRMAAVGELSAGIAHEIRNPLAAIAGSAQVLRNSKGLTPQEQRLMGIVLKESDRLNKSIADFLRFVKPQEKHASEFDIAGSLGETLELLSNSSELADHRIVSSVDPPSFLIVGDPDQIRQVFWNVARNAIQAMQAGGTLRVFTEIDDEYYRISFVDSGKGMSDEDQRRLFQPFRTGFPSGTGLGMAISYRIIQEHGGKIDVDSRPGEGTSISISIPVGKANSPEGTKPTEGILAAR